MSEGPLDSNPPDAGGDAAELYRELFTPRQGDTVLDVRQRFDALLRSVSSFDAIGVEQENLGGVPALRVTAQGTTSDRALLWFHGGGYSIGSATGHTGLAGRLSAACGVAVIVPDYRLVPEHRFPAAVEDALCAANWLVETYGGENSFIGGDSAGGALTVAAMCRQRDEGGVLPASAVAVSPLVDLTATAASYETNRMYDTALSTVAVKSVRRAYLRDHDPRDPLASPVFGDLSGLPPVLVQASTTEVLVDDARELVRRITTAAGTATLSLYEGMVHAWPLFGSAVPEADNAVREIARFIQGASVDSPRSLNDAPTSDDKGLIS